MSPLSHLHVTPLLAETAAPAADSLGTGTVLFGFLLLAMFWLISAVSGLRHEVAELKDALAGQPPPAVRSAAPAPAPAGPSSRELAAIAAAVHQVCGTGARVVAVVPPDAGAQAWSREGRRAVFQSHQIR